MQRWESGRDCYNLFTTIHQIVIKNSSICDVNLGITYDITIARINNNKEDRAMNKTIKVEEIKEVYSGRIGCQCGCRGKYWSEGPMLKKVAKLLNESEKTNFAEDNAYAFFEDQDLNRTYVAYFKEGGISHE